MSENLLKKILNNVMADSDMFKFEISKISIYGLFGNLESKTEINFEKKIQIFTGENGTGKTTILNIVYNVLKGNQKALKELPFDAIVLDFKNKKSLFLKKKWFSDTNIKLNDLTSSRFTKLLMSLLSITNEFDIKGENKDKSSQVRRHTRTKENHRSIFEKLNLLDSELLDDRLSDEKITDEYLGDNYIEYHYSNTKELNIEYVEEFNLRIALYYYIILNFYNEKIIYFPTYRRIEEELYSIKENPFIRDEIEEEWFEKSELMSFGLSDVEELIESIENEIKDFNLEGYSEINLNLLSYMMNPLPITNDMIVKVKNQDLVNIVLNRIEGNNLKSIDKNSLKSRLENIRFDSNISDTDKVIVYFINRLIERYEMKSEREEALKTFAEVCNKYLINKKFYYNQSKIKVNVLSRNTKEIIELNNLSSGEKQIVAAFAKFILKDTSNSIVIFDEPELSLSVEWQIMYLPDIMKFSGCSKLLAVTHSPFTYHNELKNYACSLNSLFKKINFKDRNYNDQEVLDFKIQHELSEHDFEESENFNNIEQALAKALVQYSKDD